MLRNIDLEISKDHNSKNVPGETIFVPESFENKLLAPLGPEILRNLHPPFFHFFLWEADSKMLRNIGLEISKDHNSKNLSGDARAFHESFGIKLLAPLGPEISVPSLLRTPPPIKNPPLVHQSSILEIWWISEKTGFWWTLGGFWGEFAFKMAEIRRVLPCTKPYFHFFFACGAVVKVILEGKARRRREILRFWTF